MGPGPDQHLSGYQVGSSEVAACVRGHRHAGHSGHLVIPHGGTAEASLDGVSRRAALHLHPASGLPSPQNPRRPDTVIMVAGEAERAERMRPKILGSHQRGRESSSRGLAHQREDSDVTAVVVLDRVPHRDPGTHHDPRSDQREIQQHRIGLGWSFPGVSPQRPRDDVGARHDVTRLDQEPAADNLTGAGPQTHHRPVQRARHSRWSADYGFHGSTVTRAPTSASR